MILDWTIDPVLIHLGPIQIRWYGLLFAMGFFFGLKWFHQAFAKLNHPRAWVDSLLTYMIIGTLAGARLGHCFFYEPEYYLSKPWLIPAIWEGGLASHGAVVGIFVATWLYARKHRPLTWFQVQDLNAVPIAVAGGLIRLGNFFNSEIIGKPTDGTWGVIFHRVDPVPRIPAQLFESLSYFAIAGILYALYRKPRTLERQGTLFGSFLALVFGARFCLEFTKENQVGFEADLGGLNLGQWLSIPVVLFGLYLIFRPHPRNTQSAN
jgi:phosphatidylglycerol---prolipoprotein diacylglyceryl transferase